MASRLRASKPTFLLAWRTFILALLAWFVLRGAFRFGAVCDLLIAIALAAQAWLLFLQAEKRQ
jgi:hypothetical protein